MPSSSVVHRSAATLATFWLAAALVGCSLTLEASRRNERDVVAMDRTIVNDLGTGETSVEDGAVQTDGGFVDGPIGIDEPTVRLDVPVVTNDVPIASDGLLVDHVLVEDIPTPTDALVDDTVIVTRDVPTMDVQRDVINEDVRPDVVTVDVPRDGLMSIDAPLACVEPEINCGGRCINALGDVRNCGGCGNACAFPNALAECRAGVCALGMCNPGFGNCDGIMGNGCETDLTTALNCGSCGNRCLLGRMCPFLDAFGFRACCDFRALTRCADTPCGATDRCSNTIGGVFCCPM